MENLGDDMVFTEDLETLKLRAIAAAEGKLDEFEKRVAIKEEWRLDMHDVLFLICISHFFSFSLSLFLSQED